VGIEVFLSLIDPPECKDLLELIRLLELSPCGRVTLELGSLVPILLPIRDDLMELIRLPKLPSCGRVTRTLDSLVPTLLLIPKLLLELMRLLELPI
jgi:hypothetical protein